MKMIPRITTPSDEINTLDLEPMKKKLMENLDDPKAWNRGWSRKNADLTGELYKTFLYICLKYPSEKIVPIREIDEFWHTHILFTEKYFNDCDKIFGYYLHHTPEENLRRTAKEEEKVQSELDRTREMVFKEFPFLRDWR